eukprot:Colp12_sorted_trinity150504_noHs@3461
MKATSMPSTEERQFAKQMLSRLQALMSKDPAEQKTLFTTPTEKKLLSSEADIMDTTASMLLDELDREGEHKFIGMDGIMEESERVIDATDNASKEIGGLYVDSSRRPTVWDVCPHFWRNWRGKGSRKRRWFNLSVACYKHMPGRLMDLYCGYTMYYTRVDLIDASSGTPYRETETAVEPVHFYVGHRYQEYTDFYNRLVDAYGPNCVDPLPENTHEPHLCIHRLDAFMKSVSASRVASQSDVLLEFLGLDQNLRNAMHSVEFPKQVGSFVQQSVVKRRSSLKRLGSDMSLSSVGSAQSDQLEGRWSSRESIPSILPEMVRNVQTGEILPIDEVGSLTGQWSLVQ